MISKETKEEVGKILADAWGQEGIDKSGVVIENYRVYYSPISCDTKNCTLGNSVKLKTGMLQPFRKHVDTRRKVVYWAFGEDELVCG